MLSEMFAVGRDEATNELTLVAKSFQQSPWHGVKVPEVGQ
jgi:hypothetical protein